MITIINKIFCFCTVVAGLPKSLELYLIEFLIVIDMLLVLREAANVGIGEKKYMPYGLNSTNVGNS